MTTSQSLKIEGQKYYYHRYLKFSTGFKVGVKPKQIEPFAKQHQFDNSSLKKPNREQKQTNAPLGPRHWQCTEQFGQLCLASDFTCNDNYDKVTDVNSDHRHVPDLNTVSDANDVHGHSSQEIGVQIDRENSNVDEPNIHDSSKRNDGNAEQTDSIVDGDVEQKDVSQNIIQSLQSKTVSKDIGMEKADETTNINGETSFIDPGKDLSVQGGVEMNNATPLEGSLVILGEQDIVLDGDDQMSNSEEFEWNDDGDGGYEDNSEVENDSSDSSVELT